MTGHNKAPCSHRYQLVHGDDADFVTYQRYLGDGVWQTCTTWMIPRSVCA